MRILVVGIEHSCTRFMTGLMKIHPQVDYVFHLSVPTKLESPDLEQYWKDHAFDKAVTITRDRCCNDLSYLKSSSVAKMCGKELSGKPLGSGSDVARSHLQPFLENHKDDVVVVSVESLFQYKELVLKQTFRLLGLSEEGYDYQNTGKIWHDWFSASLDPADPNEKYFTQKWP